MKFDMEPSFFLSHLNFRFLSHKHKQTSILSMIHSTRQRKTGTTYKIYPSLNFCFPLSPPLYLPLHSRSHTPVPHTLFRLPSTFYTALALLVSPHFPRLSGMPGTFHPSSPPAALATASASTSFQLAMRKS